MTTKTMTREECDADLCKMIEELNEAGMRVQISASTCTRRIRESSPRSTYCLEVASTPPQDNPCAEMAWVIKGNLQKVYAAVSAMHMVITYQAAAKRQKAA